MTMVRLPMMCGLHADSNDSCVSPVILLVIRLAWTRRLWLAAYAVAYVQILVQTLRPSCRLACHQHIASREIADHHYL